MEGANNSAVKCEGSEPKFRSIHAAAEFGCKDVVDVFLNKGDNVNKINKYGWTPLHFAARGGKLDVIEYLINRGADFSAREGITHNEPLHVAAEEGHVNIVEFLLSKGVDVNVTNKYKFTPMHYAAGNGNLEIVHILSDKNADLYAETTTYLKPIHAAAKKGHKDVVEFFVSKDMHIDERVASGYTPLHFAAMQDKLELINFLIDKNANIHAECNSGLKPIHVAAQYGRKNVIEYFLDKGLNVNECSKKGWAPLHYATQCGYVNVIRFLLEHGADIHNKSLYIGSNLLCTAALNGYRGAVKLFLELGFDPNTPEFCGNTPLHVAAEKGYLSIAKYLIQNGANINPENSTGEKPIHIAIENGHKNIVQFFLHKNVSIDDINKHNWTLLHYAIANLQFKLMKYLVRKGANIKARTNVGVSPLCMAALYRPLERIPSFVVTNKDKLYEDKFYETNIKKKHINAKIIDYLLDKDTGINDPNESGLVPLHYAIKGVKGAVGQEVFYITEKLVNAGAKCDIQDSRGLTPLHYAVEDNYLSAVEKIVKSKCNLNVKCNEGNTPLLLACKKHNIGIIKCFLKAGARTDIKDNDGRTVLFYYICNYVNNDDENLAFAHEMFEKIDNFIDIDDKKKKTAAHLVSEVECNTEFIKLILQKQKDLNRQDIDGNTPLNYLTEEWSISQEYKCAELIRLFVEYGAYLKMNDFQRIIEYSSLKGYLLSDVKFCIQSVVNKFNNNDLPTLYKLPSSISLPSIEKMKLKNNKIKKIEHIVEVEIKSEGFWNSSKTMLSSLYMLAVESYISHFSTGSS